MSETAPDELDVTPDDVEGGVEGAPSRERGRKRWAAFDPVLDQRIGEPGSKAHAAALAAASPPSHGVKVVEA